MRLGVSDDQIHASCKIDPWFLAEIRGIVDAEAEDQAEGPADHAPARWRRLKGNGLFGRQARQAHRARSPTR